MAPDITKLSKVYTELKISRKINAKPLLKKIVLEGPKKIEEEELADVKKLNKTFVRDLKNTFATKEETQMEADRAISQVLSEWNKVVANVDYLWLIFDKNTTTTENSGALVKQLFNPVGQRVEESN